MSEPKPGEAIRRLPLEDGTRAHQLSRAFQLQGWIYGDSIQPDATRPREVIWVTQDDETTVHLIEDQFIGKSYALIRGPQHETVTEVVARVAPVVTLDEAEQGLAREDLDDLAAASLFTAAALAADRNRLERCLALFRRGLTWPGGPVRAAMVEALAYVEWPEVPALVESLSAEDPDSEVRAHARALLQTFPQVGHDDR